MRGNIDDSKMGKTGGIRKGYRGGEEKGKCGGDTPEKVTKEWKEMGKRYLFEMKRMEDGFLHTLHRVSQKLYVVKI